MYTLWRFLFVSLCLSFVEAGWWEDLVNGRTVELNRDVSISLRRMPNLDNASYLASHALHIDLLGIGVSFSKSRGLDGLSVGLYLDKEGDHEEARGRKHKNIASMFLPVVMGYKAAAILMGTIMIVSGILLKSMLAAKIALLLSGSVGLQKLFESKSEESHQIHLYPEFEDTHQYSNSQDFHASGSYQRPYLHDDGNYELSETNISPQYVSSPKLTGALSNVSTTPSSQAGDIKRRFLTRKKAIVKPPVFTIHRITKE